MIDDEQQIEDFGNDQYDKQLREYILELIYLDDYKTLTQMFNTARFQSNGAELADQHEFNVEKIALKDEMNLQHYG